MDYYYLKPFPLPLKFYNLQEIYSRQYLHEISQLPSLEKAVTDTQIPIDEPFHCAKNDAYYTAKVFQKMNRTNLSDQYSIDYYHYPTCEDEEIFSQHSNYTEYISRPFATKNDAMASGTISTLHCCICNRKLKKRIQWFSNNSTSQICVGKCWIHGLICGKAHFKSTRDGRIFVIKTVRKIDKKEYERIKTRKNELRIKRKERRHQKKRVS